MCISYSILSSYSFRDLFLESFKNECLKIIIWEIIIGNLWKMYIVSKANVLRNTSQLFYINLVFLRQSANFVLIWAFWKNFLAFWGQNQPNKKTNKKTPPSIKMCILKYRRVYMCVLCKWTNKYIVFSIVFWLCILFVNACRNFFS